MNTLDTSFQNEIEANIDKEKEIQLQQHINRITQHLSITARLDIGRIRMAIWGFSTGSLGALATIGSIPVSICVGSILMSIATRQSRAPQGLVQKAVSDTYQEVQTLISILDQMSIDVLDKKIEEIDHFIASFPKGNSEYFKNPQSLYYGALGLLGFTGSAVLAQNSGENNSLVLSVAGIVGGSLISLIFSGKVMKAVWRYRILATLARLLSRAYQNARANK